MYLFWRSHEVSCYRWSVPLLRICQRGTKSFKHIWSWLCVPEKLLTCNLPNSGASDKVPKSRLSGLICWWVKAYCLVTQLRYHILPPCKSRQPIIFLAQACLEDFSILWFHYWSGYVMKISWFSEFISHFSWTVFRFKGNHLTSKFRDTDFLCAVIFHLVRHPPTLSASLTRRRAQAVVRRLLLRGCTWVVRYLSAGDDHLVEADWLALDKACQATRLQFWEQLAYGSCKSFLLLLKNLWDEYQLIFVVSLAGLVLPYDSTCLPCSYIVWLLHSHVGDPMANRMTPCLHLPWLDPFLVFMLISSNIFLHGTLNSRLEI